MADFDKRCRCSLTIGGRWLERVDGKNSDNAAELAMIPLTPENLQFRSSRHGDRLEVLEDPAEGESTERAERDAPETAGNLLQAYIRDQASVRAILSAEEEHDLFTKLERKVRFAHTFRLKHPITLLYVERLYNKVLTLPTQEAGDELSLFVRTADSRHVPEQLHGSRLASFLEHASDHRVICQQTMECFLALAEARRNDPAAVPLLKARLLTVLSRSAEFTRELALVPGHFLAISQLINSHCADIRNGQNSWADSELARLDPMLGLTPTELQQRCRTLNKAEEQVEALRKTAIESNLRLVVSIAMRYRNKGLELLDLIQEGNLGLMKAVDRFDHRLGTRFSTYAAHWIQQSIKKALIDKARPIRLPEGKAELLVALSRTTAMLTQRLHRAPNVDELAREVGMSPGVISHLLDVAASPLSLQRPFATDQNEEVDLRDVIADRNVVYPWEIVDRRYLRDLLPDLLRVLSDRDRRIIELRYGIGTDDGEPLTLVEVARLVNKGVKVVHRRQIESIRKRQVRALQKLQHPARTRHLI